MGGRAEIKASRKLSWLRIQIFPMEQPQSSLRTKRRIQPIHPWAFITPWRQQAQGAEGKTEEEFLSLLGYDSVQELAKDCKSSFEILYHVPNKKNRTGSGEEPHTSSLYSLQIANSLWADDSLPLKEAFAGRLSEYFYTDVFQGDLQSGEAGEAMAGWVKERTGGLIQPEPAPLPEKCAAFFKEYHLFLRSVAGPVFSGDHRGGCVLYG